jgi:hypothetical protein
MDNLPTLRARGSQQASYRQNTFYGNDIYMKRKVVGDEMHNVVGDQVARRLKL